LQLFECAKHIYTSIWRTCHLLSAVCTRENTLQYFDANMVILDSKQY
jgi:hypothetical protein